MKTGEEFIGARIKELRKARRLSQEQLSEKVDINPKHLSRIEVGKNYPSLHTLEKIAKALNIEMKDIFEFMHLDNSKEKLLKDINGLLKEADRKKLEIILKVIRAVVR